MLEIIGYVLSGMGVSYIWDKTNPTIPANSQTGISSWGPLKLAFFAGLLITGAFLFFWLNKKLHLIKRSR